MSGRELQAWVGQRARELRREMTPQEQALWKCLRAKRFAGFKFRRQEPIGRYIADFVCFGAKLVVELDGSQHHDQHEHDAQRDAWLQLQGFKVLRFWNSEWTAHPEAVLEAVLQALSSGADVPPPQPLPHEGGGASDRYLPSPLVGEGPGERDSRA